MRICRAGQFYIKLERKAYKAGTHTMAAKKDVKLEGAGRVKRLSFAVLAVQRGGLSQAGANAVISFKSSGLFQKDA